MDPGSSESAVAVKAIADAIAFVLMLPLGLVCGLERRLRPHGEGVFHFCAHAAALWPGLPGAYLRRAFYRLTLDHCDARCHIGFGALFTHRRTRVGRGVYVGTWAIVGSADLRDGTSVGSRASLLSGTALHEFRDGAWTPFDATKLTQISLGPQAFIGEGAIVMADVGARTMVSAGAVVSAAVPDGIVVAGNPARFVRRLEPPAAVEPETARVSPATAGASR